MNKNKKLTEVLQLIIKRRISDQMQAFNTERASIHKGERYIFTSTLFVLTLLLPPLIRSNSSVLLFFP